MSPSPQRRARTGASPVVTIEGEVVRARLPEGSEACMSVADFFEKMASGLPDTRGGALSGDDPPMSLQLGDFNVAQVQTLALCETLAALRRR